ncbi:alpha/beta hydrolase [Candidatus Symbiothrix dinenymphae]|uniref:alpha/beta hydrolase n=1 Tax=Candidatus Symbiothrix dinenymphae TaxID=467085 RepID=UPI0006C3795C|nr:alpha/beta hydrolase [Candidatus Symbiothrix dinenymphae]GAP72299.1 xylanase [Candidatus Symbiothrix dinenymphae]
MKKIIATSLFVLFMSSMNAQTSVKLGAGDAEITIYLPKASVNKHKAVIICPGGGYGGLAIQHEGHQVAEWLKEQGYVGIVLKYRLPEKKYKNIPLEDVQTAFRYARSKAGEWNITKVGIAGFSAGGHLAATASTHYTDSITRPDFSILFYPVISMDKDIRHDGSRINLLGDNPPATDLHIYSNEKQVNAQTPPAILLLSDDDNAVLPQNSILYYQALKRNNIPATLYIFPTGGHGWGMNDTFQYKKEMLTLLKSWLDASN